MTFKTATVSQAKKVTPTSNLFEVEIVPKGKSSNEPKVALLLVGETGSGKTTLLNAIINFAVGNYELSKVEHFVASSASKESHTQVCTRYVMPKFEIIDTPGFSDTNGSSQDEKHVQSICDAVSQQQFLDAIVFVINGSDPRLNLSFGNTLVKLSGMLPDAIANKVIAFTNCSACTLNFQIDKYCNLLKTPHSFTFQNAAFRAFEKKHTRQIQNYFADACETMKMLYNTIQGMQKSSTNPFKEMMEKRNALNQKKDEIVRNWTEVNKLIGDLTTATLNLHTHTADKNNSMLEKTVDSYEQVFTSYHNTICLACGNVCHENCSLKKTVQVGHKIFHDCACMKSDKITCNACQHSVKDHFHANYIYKKKKITIREYLQTKLRNAEKGIAMETKNIETTTQAIKDLEKHANTLIVHLRLTCQEVRNVCSFFNFANEINVVIERLRKEILGVHNLKQQEKMTSQISQLEALCANLEPCKNLVDDSAAQENCLTDANLLLTESEQQIDRFAKVKVAFVNLLNTLQQQLCCIKPSVENA